MQFSVPHEEQVVRGCLSAPWKEKDLKTMHMTCKCSLLRSY